MVLVDELKDYGWIQGMSCHMFTDGDVTELHEFAQLAGIGSSYFHVSKGFEHYDLTAKNRIKAVAHGATQVTARDAVKLRQIRRQNAKV